MVRILLHSRLNKRERPIDVVTRIRPRSVDIHPLILQLRIGSKRLVLSI